MPPNVLDKLLFILHELSPRDYTRLPSVKSDYPFPLWLAPWKETWALIPTNVAMESDKQELQQVEGINIPKNVGLSQNQRNPL